MCDITTEKLRDVQTQSVNVVHALSGLQLLLESLTQKSQNQFDELYSCDVLLKLIIRQAEETSDTLFTVR
jgi:hypothetical protein